MQFIFKSYRSVYDECPWRNHTLFGQFRINTFLFIATYFRRKTKQNSELASKYFYAISKNDWNVRLFIKMKNPNLAGEISLHTHINHHHLQLNIINHHVRNLLFIILNFCCWWPQEKIEEGKMKEEKIAPYVDFSFY